MLKIGGIFLVLTNIESENEAFALTKKLMKICAWAKMGEIAYCESFFV